MIDRLAAAEAKRVLGRRLADLRKAAGYSQHQLAPLTLYARSTVANVEIGRQYVPRTFWQRCDDTLNTGGALTRDYDELQALIRRQHAKSAQSRRIKAPEPAEDGEQHQGVVDAVILRIRIVLVPPARVAEPSSADS